MFAKLYGPDDDQILVVCGCDTEGRPALRYFYRPEGLDVCEATLSFKDSDEGQELAERHFATQTEESARKAFSTLFRILEGR